MLHYQINIHILYYVIYVMACMENNNHQKKSNHPEWALKFKRKGTELRLIKGKYYLYEATSKWNAEKKRAQKISGKILGRITPEGFIKSREKQIISSPNAEKSPICVKEYGLTKFTLDHFKIYLNRLQEYFPDRYREIFTLALIRLAYHSPIKNVQFYFEHSFLSELYSDVSLHDKRVSSILRETGIAREKCVEYMRSFIRGKDFILIDGTHIISHSQHMEINKIGYNSKRQFDPQFNLMFLFSSKLNTPIFYRILPGNIREIRSFKLSIEESGINDAIVIADKGFYSQLNVSYLEEEKLKYILPLRRDLTLIDYSRIEQPKKGGFDGYFNYHNRYIWYYKIQLDKRNVIVYFDEMLKVKEEHDYLRRIDTHPDEYNLDQFQEKHPRFGTLALLINLRRKNPYAVYQYYKSREEIEIMFDTIKNIIHSDSSYMQNEDSLNGWMFVNQIALQWYYQIFKLISKKELTSRYSVKDLVIRLSEIKKVRINGVWKNAEITAKTQSFLDKLELHIT